MRRRITPRASVCRCSWSRSVGIFLTCGSRSGDILSVDSNLGQEVRVSTGVTIEPNARAPEREASRRAAVQAVIGPFTVVGLLLGVLGLIIAFVLISAGPPEPPTTFNPKPEWYMVFALLFPYAASGFGFATGAWVERTAKREHMNRLGSVLVAAGLIVVPAMTTQRILAITYFQHRVTYSTKDFYEALLWVIGGTISVAGALIAQRLFARRLLGRMVGEQRN